MYICLVAGVNSLPKQSDSGESVIGHLKQDYRLGRKIEVDNLKAK